jgi:phosphoribosyl 1,2-cyclic phosphodiesterase/ActR/RegA family two-component response regulator
MSQASQKTVLVIDDDPDYRKCICEILEHNGWRAWDAEDGQQGVEMAKSHRPSVVICDLLMPKCNGFQVCRLLRQETTLRGTKIVVSSGRQFASDLQAASEAGADQYLAKPADASQLLLLLTRLVEEAPEPPSFHPTSTASEALPPRLKFWGVRGSIPTPGPTTVEYGGNTSCIEIRADGHLIILDGGSGLRPLGRALVEEFGQQPLNLTLLLTHTHWDHIQGLPFFLPVYKPQNQLRILGYEGARHGLHNILTSQMETPFFPIGLRELPANVHIEEIQDLSFNIGSLRVQAFFANHPGICVGYRLFTSGGSIAFFPDNEPLSGARAAVSEQEANETTTGFAKNENRKLIEFLRGSDVLIMDTQYDLQEYQRHVGWGHGCLDQVVALAIEAEAKQLFLFHHDPDHDDAKISHMVAHARELVERENAPLRVEAAKEGLVVELVTGEGKAAASVPGCSNS